MKTTSSDGTYIEYFNTVHGFGIRVLEDRCFVVIQIGDDQPIFGHAHQIPIQFEAVPSHVRLIVDDHLMNYPSSDLVEVLAGKKPLQEALDSPTRIEPQRMTPTRNMWLPRAS